MAKYKLNRLSSGNYRRHPTTGIITTISHLRYMLKRIKKRRALNKMKRRSR